MCITTNQRKTKSNLNPNLDSAPGMTYIASGGVLNSTHSLASNPDPVAKHSAAVSIKLSIVLPKYVLRILVSSYETLIFHPFYQFPFSLSLCHHRLTVLDHPVDASHSVALPTPHGVVGLVAHVADGSTKSETTPARHLPTSGDRPSDAVIMDERRDGPRWLCSSSNRFV